MPMNVIYRGSADLPEIIPVFPLSGALLLPRGQLPLNIFEPRYLAMIDDSLDNLRTAKRMGLSTVWVSPDRAADEPW